MNEMVTFRQLPPLIQGLSAHVTATSIELHRENSQVSQVISILFHVFQKEEDEENFEALFHRQ